MKKIVRGNDFTLRIAQKRQTADGSEAIDVTKSEGVSVSSANGYKRYVLESQVSADDDSVVTARVEGDQIPCGTYAVEVKGLQGGNDWRTAEVGQLQVVEWNHDADTDLGDVVDGEVVTIEALTVGAGGTWSIERNRLLLNY